MIPRSRLGIGSWTFPWAIGVPGYPRPERPLDPAGLLRKAVELGVGVVQFADNLPLLDLPRRDVEALREIARDSGIAIELGTRGAEPAHLAACLELCRQLDVRLLRTLTRPATSSPDLAQVRDWVKDVLPDFEAAQVALAFENYERHTAAELAGLIESIGSPQVGVCLDMVNSLGALETPRQVVEILAPYVLNLHMKDFEISRVPSMMGYVVEGRPVGQGRIPVGWVLEELARRGRTPNVIIELWTPFENSLEQTIAKEQDWARRSVAYLLSSP